MLTYNRSTVLSEGDTWRVFANISPDTSYPSGGYLVRPNNLRLQQIKELVVPNNPAGLMFMWDAEHSKLLIGSSSGSGSFSGSPLAPHTHLLTPSQSGLTPDPGLYMSVAGAVGTFTIGETITGGSTGSTGVVVISNIGLVNYTPTGGRFDFGETITGGTSGFTQTANSLPYARFPFPVPTTLCTTCYDDDITSVAYKPVPSYRILPNIIMTLTGPVGAFFQGELITGGTSGATGRIAYVQGGSTHLEVILATGNFQVGETVTGGTSLATGTLSTFYQERIFYHNLFDSSVAIDSNIAPTALFAIYQENRDITAVSAGTPSGTITGGGVFSELAPGTNVFSLLPNFDIIAEGL